MRGRLIGVALGAVLAGSAAFAADYETVLDLPAGTKIDLTIQRTRSGTRIPTPMTMTFRYREVTPTAEGYRVRQKMTGSETPPGISEAERAQLDQASAIVADLTYDADESLAPVRIDDWKGLIDRMATAMGGPNDRMVDTMRQMFGRMTPEVAAQSLMKEQGRAAAPQNVGLDLGKPVGEAQQVPNPLGGPPIASTYSIRLESLDRASGRAVIVSRQALDPESASRSVKQALEALTAKMSPELRPAEALAGVKIERTLDCRSEMDIATGLAVSTDCTQTVTGVDQTLKTQTQVDRWVITQALVKP